MNYTQHANGMRTWPALYKKDRRGKRWRWEVAVVPCVIGPGSIYGNEEEVIHASLRVLYGEVGRSLQTPRSRMPYFHRDEPVERATVLADARWLKKKAQGYAPCESGVPG